MQRLRVFILIALAFVGHANAFQASTFQDHGAWVVRAMQRMQTIKPGMTREALLKVFTTEGGLSTGLHRTYVYPECPYFKVDVEFEAIGRPERDADGRVTLIEDRHDIIVKISRPYLQFSILD